MLVEAPSYNSRYVRSISTLGIGNFAALLMSSHARDMVGVYQLACCCAWPAHYPRREEVAEVDATDSDDFEERVDFPPGFFVAEIFD